MKTSKVSRIFALAAFLSGALALAACSGAPGEQTGSDEGAMRCRPGTPCDPAGNIGCDPTTTCCYAGGQTMGSSACGGLLYQAGCRATNGTNKAFAVETDGFGHWWFEAYCPSSAGYVANDPRCVSAGIHFNYWGNSCTVSNPGPGQVDVIYDPNCPSGCRVLAN